MTLETPQWPKTFIVTAINAAKLKDGTARYVGFHYYPDCFHLKRSQPNTITFEAVRVEVEPPHHFKGYRAWCSNIYLETLSGEVPAAGSICSLCFFRMLRHLRLYTPIIKPHVQK